MKLTIKSGQRLKFQHQHNQHTKHRSLNFKVLAKEGQKGGGLGDSLLDYIQAGPKMRRWYGQGERLPSQADFENDQKPQIDEDIPKDKILVLHTSTLIDEILLLSLVVKQSNLKILCQNADEMKDGFGPYADIVSGDINNKNYLKNCLKDVRIVISVGPIGSLSQVANESGVQHIVALSMVGASSGGLGGIFDGEQNMLKDQRREQQIIDSGVGYSIIRVGGLNNAGKGSSQVSIVQSTETVQLGKIGREDLGDILASIAEACDERSSSQNLSVVSSNEILNVQEVVKQFYVR
eukprot:TRINITY_DN6208_c0_g1_i11.p2 TRINITY_DN6208_c0_g1~~TRINITY_DN6208_c0_g1_i11.p2  ORF type:complete len:293 (-),score=41.81 TRINITY_DN6208_c0_g1_i11:250-1128(-)